MVSSGRCSDVRSVARSSHPENHSREPRCPKEHPTSHKPPSPFDSHISRIRQITAASSYPPQRRLPHSLLVSSSFLHESFVETLQQDLHLQARLYTSAGRYSSSKTQPLSKLAATLAKRRRCLPRSKKRQCASLWAVPETT